MIWRIDVFSKIDNSYPKIISEVRDLGVKKEFDVFFKKVYFIESALPENEIKKIADQLLIDPVIEDYSLGEGIFPQEPLSSQVLITYNPGVCDPIAMSLEKAIGELSLKIKSVRTAKFYEFKGLGKEQIDYLCPKLLYNPLIEHVLGYEKTKELSTLDEFSGKDYKFDLVEVDLLGADKNKLLEISNQGCLSLSLEEMQIIQDYFKSIKRNPTDCELETIATLWSEHCAHKTFRGVIDYQELNSDNKVIKEETITNLLKSTIMKATSEISSLDCVSVFGDNSGVVKFDEDYNICFKVETHNHPSALEPYGGASTGIGGVIRDILGTGCAARPFASIDVFCFSPWQISHQELPKGLLHPKRIIKGVIKGVRDYGNRMGIPTVAGSLVFDDRFLGNPLVYCGTLGILPKEKSFKKANVGDLVILCGARTGRDGIHGATFSSKELDEQTVGLTSAVQIGNPIEEKKLTEAILRARDKNLFTAITDCGAGGISSAITELAQDYGVEVYLEKVPLKYKGLNYTEIWISESQERMVFFANFENLGALEEIFKEEDVELTVVGKVTDTNRLVLFYEDNKVCELDMEFIFELPRLKKKALWIAGKEKDYKLPKKKDYTQDLKDLLSSYNIASKDWVIREYDHEVQAQSVGKPINGIENIAVNDASILRPDLKSDKCVAVGLGVNPFYYDLDPYWMAASSIDEALRNIIACGGNITHTYILDNFSWGSPLDEKILGSLVRASKACYDFSTYFKVPFISGKDSLYNEYMVGKKHISIPGTLLISAVSVISDWRKCISANFKEKDNLIYAIGLTKPQLGASEYFRKLNIKEGLVPKVDKEIAKDVFLKVSEIIDKGLVKSCHDCSEGGMAVTIAEMCIGSGKGANIFLSEAAGSKECRDYEILFSESPSRFIIEVQKADKEKVEQILTSSPFGLIGCVSEEPKLTIYGKDSQKIIESKIDDLKESWLTTFKDFR